MSVNALQIQAYIYIYVYVAPDWCLNVYNDIYGTEDHEKVIGCVFLRERENEVALFILEFLYFLPYITLKILLP